MKNKRWLVAIVLLASLVAFSPVMVPEALAGPLELSLASYNADAGSVIVAQKDGGGHQRPFLGHSDREPEKPVSSVFAPEFFTGPMFTMGRVFDNICYALMAFGLTFLILAFLKIPFIQRIMSPHFDELQLSAVQFRDKSLTQPLAIAAVGFALHDALRMFAAIFMATLMMTFT